MIKFFLAAIIALSLIGGAIKFESDVNSWKLVVIKQEALHSVQTGAIRIYKIVEELISCSDISDSSSIVVEEG